jgi:sugar/nucleoside kinase (ribokinase family)
MVELDYLAIGHVTRDLADGAFTIGGTVSYASRTARAMGCRVGVVTSARSDLGLTQVLQDILVARLPAPVTTTFENVYTSSGRRQVVCGVAETLTRDAVPQDWQMAPIEGIVHLGPVARECDPALIDAFKDAFVGLTPQGWMRCWNQEGRISRCRWTEAEKSLARAEAVVISEEDVAGDPSLIARYAAQAQLLVVTRGAAGCDVYQARQARHFPAPAAQEVDSTGSGDIFAAAFFVEMRRTGDPWVAARFANCVAAGSVTRAGLSGTPNPEEIAHCKRALETR